MSTPSTSRATPGSTYGLLLGPGVGLVLALLFADSDGDAVAFGLVIGAALGVVVGALWDSTRARPS